MKGEQNGPCNKAAGEADVTNHLEEAQKEEAIKRSLIEDMGVGCLEEWLDPSEPTVGQGRSGRSNSPC